MTEDVARSVQRDLDQPRPTRQVGPWRRVLDCADEGILHHVFRVGGAAEHAVTQAPEKRPMLRVGVCQRECHRATAIPTSVPGSGTEVRPGTAVCIATATASAALAALASDSWPRGPTQSPAIATLSRPSSRAGGRPPTPPIAAVVSACVTLRFGRNCFNST